jgi:hypothetical protein
LGRERETTDNVLFAIIPSPLPFKDCKVIGEGEGNHGQQGFLEHILDVLHIHWFLRYLINTLSCTFENRLLKQLKTFSKCIKLPRLFSEFYFARNFFLHLRA